MEKCLIIGGTAEILTYTLHKLVKKNYQIILTGIEEDILNKIEKEYPSIDTRILKKKIFQIKLKI